MNKGLCHCKLSLRAERGRRGCQNSPTIKRNQNKMGTFDNYKLSNCRIAELPNCRIVELSNCRIVELSN